MDPLSLPGICGPRGGNQCKIAHSSRYSNKIGTYPSQFLPSNGITLWRAVFASQFPLQVQDNFPAVGLITGLVPIAAFIPVIPKVHTFQSHHTIIFAKTANRLNLSHTLTQEEINSIDDSGIGIIDVGEYIFEPVAVTDVEEEILVALTDAEKVIIEESGESEADFAFRKLFNRNTINGRISIINNRLVGTVPNSLGVEYRFDNGTRKSLNIMDQAGAGDLNSVSYRDGTSKKIKVDLVKITERRPVLDGDTPPPAGSLQAEARSPVVGDTIFLTYVAVKEHYLRQKVQISWQTIDPGTANLGSPCISLPLGYSIAHYRFFEWDMEPEDGDEGVTSPKLSGWRIVESFRANSNFVAPVEQENGNIVLADFPVGRQRQEGSTISTEYLPGEISESQLNEFRSDSSTLPRYETALTESTQGAGFHINSGVGGNDSSYLDSEWFGRKSFSRFINKRDASEHVLYNVHPKALRKRDIDKWGIERFLADEIGKDINKGKITFFPFMDDPSLDDPTSFDGANESLDGSNTKFMPIEPVGRYGGNFEAICGSIGSFPTNPTSGINTYHAFESRIISERFDENTHILVEQNVAVGAGPLGPNLITIEGSGSARGSVTCISDPTGAFAFAGHVNDDGFLIYNAFNTGHMNRGIESLTFRPDLEAPPVKDNLTPSIDQFVDLLGFTSMLGDSPGFQPGKAIALSSFAEFKSFVFKTTDPSRVRERYSSIEDDQIEEITTSKNGNIIISVGSSYHGSLLLNFDLSSGFESKDEGAILLIKSGSVISGSIDTIVIRPTVSSSKGALTVNFHWMSGDTLELIGPRIEDMTITYAEVTSVKPSKNKDFLSGQVSHDLSFSILPTNDRLTDRSLFFGTDMVSMSEDHISNLFIFFSDENGGISVAASQDFGSHWHYHYGIVESMDVDIASAPFVVTPPNENSCYLFFLFRNKILCKKIPFNLFEFSDANLIERFSVDVLSIGASENGLNVESDSIYSDSGRTLRRKLLCHAAAGDLTDEIFRQLSGKVPGEFEYKPFEVRVVDGQAEKVRRYPIVIGGRTGFTNRDILNPFFSAYVTDVGELKLWFLGRTSGGLMLQCNFSSDDGGNWYDLWESIENRFNRMRFDPEKKTQFIDRNSDGSVEVSGEDLKGVDLLEGNQEYSFGINVHWSRLKRHKIRSDEGEVSINSESIVLPVSSPYVFYQSGDKQLFLFYVYENCLLCKIFNEDILTRRNTAQGSSPEGSGMVAVKYIIERVTKSHFVDGFLKDNINLHEEIHGFFNEETNEIMNQGNIVFRYPFAVNSFTEDRAISAQRVCAYKLPEGPVRVFYKHTGSSNLKSALWTGTEWWAEDFLVRSSDVDTFNVSDHIHADANRVSGGFGSGAFGVV